MFLVVFLGRFHSSKPLACIDIRNQQFQRDDVNSSYRSPMDSFIFCCGFCLLCQDQFFCPMNIFPLPFPIYLSINLLISLGRSLWTQCVIGEGCFYRVQVTLWNALSAVPLCLMPVLCPRALPIIFMTLIKCAVNIKPLKWWRWNHFERITGLLALFFALLRSIFLLKCIWTCLLFIKESFWKYGDIQYVSFDYNEKDLKKTLCCNLTFFANMKRLDYIVLRMFL